MQHEVDDPPPHRPVPRWLPLVVTGLGLAIMAGGLLVYAHSRQGERFRPVRLEPEVAAEFERLEQVLNTAHNTLVQLQHMGYPLHFELQGDPTAALDQLAKAAADLRLTAPVPDALQPAAEEVRLAREATAVVAEGWLEQVTLGHQEQAARMLKDALAVVAQAQGDLSKAQQQLLTEP